MAASSSSTSVLACRTNPEVLTFPLEMLNVMAMVGRRPHVVCYGAPTCHDLTWLMVGASVNLEEPWDADQDFVFDLPVRARRFKERRVMAGKGRSQDFSCQCHNHSANYQGVAPRACRACGEGFEAGDTRAAAGRAMCAADDGRALREVAPLPAPVRCVAWLGVPDGPPGRHL